MPKVCQAMKLLVISRAYPPEIGGMQEYAYQLIRHLSQTDAVSPIVRAVPSTGLLPFFLFLFHALMKGCLFSRRVDLIYLCDAALSPLALLLKHITRKPVIIMVYGLDLSSLRLCNPLIPFCLQRLDRVLCVSRSTQAECLKRGVDPGRVSVITPGVSDEWYQPDGHTWARRQVGTRYGIATDKKILLSVGRLIERKGFHWFVAEVLPRLLSHRKDIVYLLAGQGPMERQLRSLIRNQGLSDTVIMPGGIPDRKDLALFYNAADVFIMPNIHVSGNPEGFGIVTLEAASCGVPVVASRVDGIPDAVAHGKNGLLIELGNGPLFAQAISSLLDPDQKVLSASEVRSYTLRTYEWKGLMERYRRQFERLIRREAVGNSLRQTIRISRNRHDEKQSVGENPCATIPEPHQE